MFSWNKQNTRQAVDMWMSGTSSGKIAKQFGITRNAVMGKITRLHLRREEDTGVPPITVVNLINKRNAQREQRSTINDINRTQGDVATIKKHRARAAKERVTFTPTMTLPSFESVVMAGTCQFIDGDPHNGTAVFCGHERKAGSPYCVGHHAVCYRKVRVQK